LDPTVEQMIPSIQPWWAHQFRDLKSVGATRESNPVFAVGTQIEHRKRRGLGEIHTDRSILGLRPGLLEANLSCLEDEIARRIQFGGDLHASSQALR
jgi:hypothetical protein